MRVLFVDAHELSVDLVRRIMRAEESGVGGVELDETTCRLATFLLVGLQLAALHEAGFNQVKLLG